MSMRALSQAMAEWDAHLNSIGAGGLITPQRAMQPDNTTNEQIAVKHAATVALKAQRKADDVARKAEQHAAKRAEKQAMHAALRARREHRAKGKGK